MYFLGDGKCAGSVRATPTTVVAERVVVPIGPRAGHRSNRGTSCPPASWAEIGRNRSKFGRHVRNSGHIRPTFSNLVEANAKLAGFGLISAEVDQV